MLVRRSIGPSVRPFVGLSVRWSIHRTYKIPSLELLNSRIMVLYVIFANFGLIKLR